MLVEESFFAGEEREGFFVEEKMKRAWAAEIEVLKEVERICKKYQLQYFAGYGTLLGAIRHKGFIPWDDDIDIHMLRNDYQRFLEVAPLELPEGYALLSLYTEEEWDEVFARIVNSRRIDYSRERLERFHGCPYCVGIDIFQLDYVPRDREAAMLQKEVFRVVMHTRSLLAEQGLDETEKEECLCRVEEFCGVDIDRHRPPGHQLDVLMDRLMSMYYGDEGDEVTDYYNHANGSVGLMKKEWFASEEWLPFEYTQIAVPKGYRGCACAEFGENYMIPVKSFPRDYPFYESQEKAMAGKA